MDSFGSTQTENIFKGLFSGPYAVHRIFCRFGTVYNGPIVMSLYSALGECGCKLALKFTISNSGLWPSLYRKPLALRERIFACETVEGLARSFMSFKKYKS